MKLIKKKIGQLIRYINKVYQFFKPFIQKRNYLGYNVYYSKGTSLMERLKEKNSIYEPEACTIIHKHLKNKKNPNFIDVGANIGLISLYVLRNFPSTKIYAFEPGPHQHELFKRTIRKNDLNNNIILYRTALSNFEGTTDFYVHDTKDVSGDGFLDTHRAGASKKIQVCTMRLDDWWNSVGKPQIDFIKIDTEGAELWVIEGAKELIKKCKPIILTEMNRLNYVNYPYNEFDVLNLINTYGYIVYNEVNEVVDRNKLEYCQQKNIDSYYCVPI
jgi:FkbM family methyltransferase